MNQQRVDQDNLVAQTKKEKKMPVWLWVLIIVLAIPIILIILAGIFASANKFQKYNWEKVDVSVGQNHEIKDGVAGKYIFTLYISSINQIHFCQQDQAKKALYQPEYDYDAQGQNINVNLKPTLTGGNCNAFSITASGVGDKGDPRTLNEELPDLTKNKVTVNINQENKKPAQVEISLKDSTIIINKLSDPDDFVRVPVLEIKLADYLYVLQSTKDLAYQDSSRQRDLPVDYAHILSSKKDDFLLKFNDALSSSEKNDVTQIADRVKLLQKPSLAADFEQKISQAELKTMSSHVISWDSRSGQEILSVAKNKLKSPLDIQYLTLTQYFVSGKKQVFTTK